ncbi:MAG: RidA family protein [Clostridia bacterium]|nr:RidA family protein [Clostridia bacterium]
MTTFNTEHAPIVEGGYSQAVEAGGMIFISGQMGRRDFSEKAESGFVPWASPDQAELALKNISAILEDMNADLSDIVKLTIYFTEMHCLKAIHQRIAEVLGGHAPAMSCAEVKALPRGCKVMIDAVCVRK